MTDEQKIEIMKLAMRDDRRGILCAACDLLCARLCPSDIFPAEIDPKWCTIDMCEKCWDAAKDCKYKALNDKITKHIDFLIDESQKHLANASIELRKSSETELLRLFILRELAEWIKEKNEILGGKNEINLR